MPGYDEITIRLPDGYKAYARYWAPETCRGGVLYLHGIQSHAGWYERSAAAICEAGFAVLQPDRRGSGRNQKDRGHAESSPQLLEDGRICLDELVRRSGSQRNHVLGVSWGGKMAAAMHADDASGIAGLILVTPGLFPIIDVSPAEKFRIGWSMVANPERSYDIPLNDPELFTSVPEWIQYLRDDPLQLHQATAGFFLASRRMDRVVRRLPQARPVPLHLMLAADERIIENDQTVDFVRQMRWPARAITTYQNSRHTLEFDPDGDRYLEDLVRWLDDPTGYAAPLPTESAESGS
ncbi:MAG: alpha/beta fold hydrolase [Planctomycetes bacterium]|nr:alpha/beta fold hydrolase [Planctomycetota bacterium]